MKNPIAALEDNNDPIISSAGSCTYAVKSYPMYLADESEWALRAEKVSACMQDLTSFIVSKLDVMDVDANLQGHTMYHPPCSLIRKLGTREGPLTLLKNVHGPGLLMFADQDTCCGFGRTFPIKMAEISGEMVKEKALYPMDAKPEYLIGADVSCLLSVGGRLQRESQPVRMVHVTEVPMSR